MDTPKNEVFEDLPVPAALRKMAVPAILGQLIILFYNMADTFYLGRIGNPHMVAGVSLILPLFNFCTAVAELFGLGGGTLISRLLGLNQEQEAKKVSSFCFFHSLIVSFCFSALLFIFHRPVLGFLGASADSYRYSYQYVFCVLVLGAIPTILSNVTAFLLRSIGESRRASIGTMLGGILNVILDPLFMFVLFPGGMEVVAIGLATLVSNIVACIYFLRTLSALKNRSVLEIRLKPSLPGRESILTVYRLGIPSAVMTFLFNSNYAVINRLMAPYGDIPLAAIGIDVKIERLPLNVGIGICQGMIPIIAYNSSSQNWKRTRETIRVSAASGLVIAFISICLYELFSRQIFHLFINEPTTAGIGATFLQIRCLATPLMFLSFFTVYVFNSFGEGRIALFLGIVRWLGFNIPMLFLLNRLFGMYGIVWSQLPADVLTVALSAAIYIRYIGKHAG